MHAINMLHAVGSQMPDTELPFSYPCFMDIHWSKAEVAPCQISPVMSLSQPGRLTGLCRDYTFLWDTGKLRESPLVFWLQQRWLCCLQKTQGREGESVALGRWCTWQDGSPACRDGRSFLVHQCAQQLAHIVTLLPVSWLLVSCVYSSVFLSNLIHL